jgi:molybdenum-dependent DNA-binding transcriptional regulator ModE
MTAMRLEKLRQIDLNLLITFAAIAEEKSITAAATRLLLSQPAVSRALQRVRAMFQDDLLVRSPQGFELTLRGRKILDELEGLLPRMENLVAPALSHFQLERLYKEDWICAVTRESHFGDRLLLKQYLAASHIVVSPYEGVQTIPDKQLAAVGAKRGSCIRVPYFGVALQCLPGTELVLTLTSGMTSVIKKRSQVAAREGAARIARVLSPHGLASETQH